MDKIRQKIAKIFMILSVFVFIFNAIGRIDAQSQILLITDFVFLGCFMVSLFTFFCRSRLSLVIQILTTISLAVIYINTSNEYVAILFFILSFFELYVYHFYDENRILKIILSVMFVFFVFYSYAISTGYKFPLNSIQWTILTFGSIYALYSLTGFAIGEWLSNNNFYDSKFCYKKISKRDFDE